MENLKFYVNKYQLEIKEIFDDSFMIVDDEDLIKRLIEKVLSDKLSYTEEGTYLGEISKLEDEVEELQDEVDALREQLKAR